MTIRDVIERVNVLKPNQYGDETLVAWLSNLDGLIWQDVMRGYKDAPPAPVVYSRDDMEQKLLVESPHEEMYVTYLSAKIDYQNGEYERYNNTMMLYNTQLQAFYNAYIRMHDHKHDVYIRI